MKVLAVLEHKDNVICELPEIVTTLQLDDIVTNHTGQHYVVVKKRYSVSKDILYLYCTDEQTWKQLRHKKL